MEFSQPQPVTTVSRLAACQPATTEALSALGTGHSSAAAVTVTNTVDTELIAYFADCQNYLDNSGLKFWGHCWLHLPRTCCQMLHLRHVERVLSLAVES